MAEFGRLDQVLAQRGFVSVPSPLSNEVYTPRFEASPSDGWYFGSLQTKRGSVCIYLGIPSLEFTKPPTIWLSERPSWMVGWRPHLLPFRTPLNEFLCYSDHEQFHLLAHEPERAILRVLEDAQITIDRISDPETVIADSQREISVHWDQSEDEYYCDIDPEPRIQTCRIGRVENSQGKIMHLLSLKPDLLAQKLGMNAQVPRILSAVIFPEPRKPLYLTSAGRPKNLKELWQWLKDVSPDTFDRWIKILKSKEHYAERIYYYFFRAGNQLIGYSAFSGGAVLSKVKSARERIECITKNVHREPLEITRLSVTRLDSEYLVRRNLPADIEDLRGMSVLLIGAGTIGGFVARSLVQIGAGLAKGTDAGSLVIVDPQTLESQNIGRHFLGLQYLGWKKVDAVKDVLLKMHPLTNIEAVSSRFDGIEGRLNQFHLIINATGFEPFGREISKLVRIHNWLDGKHALLHTWIEGRGGVVRTLLEDNEKAACFDCMWSYSVNQQPKLRRPAYAEDEWNQRSSDGYSTMTPFAVSASLASTALTIDSVLAWRSSINGPRFRSRSSEGRGIKPSESVNLPRNGNCPTCST